MRPTPSRAAAVALTASAAALLAAAPALAAVRAVASADTSATVATWGVAAAAVGAQPVTGSAYSVAWVPPLAPVYLDVVNTGTVGLSGTTWTATNVKPTNGTAPPEVAFDACLGGSWSSITGQCSGSVTRVGSTSGGTMTVASATTAAAAGSRLSVRVSPVTLLNFPQSFSTTLSLSVSRGQVRAATTTSG